MTLLNIWDSPAPSSQDRLDSTDRFPGLPHQEGDVAELRYGGQEPHVLIIIIISSVSTDGDNSPVSSPQPGRLYSRRLRCRRSPPGKSRQTSSDRQLGLGRGHASNWWSGGPAVSLSLIMLPTSITHSPPPPAPAPHHLL